MQDYDLRGLEVMPSLASVDEVVSVLRGAFDSLGCDIRAGARLPHLFALAGVGQPDGSDVAGRVDPLATGHVMLEQTVRSVLGVAMARHVTDDRQAAAVLEALRRDAARYPDHTLIWPLMLGAWRRKRSLPLAGTAPSP